VEVREAPVVVEGKTVAMVGALTDITERKRAEQALRESENRWRAVAENSPDYIMTLNRDLDIVFINRLAPGLSKSQVLGTPFPEFTPEFREVAIEILRRVLETGASERYETYYDGPDGARRYFENRVRPMEGGSDDAVLLVTSTDITERQRVEAELQEYREHLEEMVEERTADLRKVINSMAGREIRMIELKDVIRKLRAQLDGAGLEPVANDPLLAGEEGKNDRV
jgi:PAS domain S-box-containing protein